MRDLFERRGMGAYIQTMIDADGRRQPARAGSSIPSEQLTSLYDDTMRNQLASRPAQAMTVDEDKTVTPGQTEAKVRVGGGRGRVSRQLPRASRATACSSSGRGDPRLQILPGGSTAPTPIDPLFAVPDLFFTATDSGSR